MHANRISPRALASSLTNWLIERGDLAFIICLYTLITILFTWPLATNFTTFFPGNEKDIFHELWYLHLGSTSTYGPFFDFYTNSIGYPNGYPLYFQVLSPFNTLIFGALSRFLGEIVAYNLLYMFTYVASAFTMYILVNYLTNNKYAAFFAGIVFGFAPVHIAQALAHLNIMSSEFIPLFAYYLIKIFREDRFRNSIYAGGVLVLNAMLDLHMLLLSFTVLAVFLLYYFFAMRSSILNKQFVQRLALMLSFALVLGIAVYFQTLYGLIFAPKGVGANAAVTPLIQTIYGRSPDLVQFFIPGSENTFFGQYTAHFFHLFHSYPAVRTYMGYSALALAIVGLIAFRKIKEVFAWGLLVLVGFLMSIGPFVQIMGKITPIPAPWLFFYYVIPLFQSFRTPYRFSYDLMLGLGVLAGYGVARLMTAIGNSKRKRTRLTTVKKIVVMVVLCSILIAEFLPAPYPEISATPPQIYQILAADHSNYTVLEVPATQDNHIFLYYQSIYNHPLINGYDPRAPQFSYSFIETTPFINQLGVYNPGHAPPDIINQSYSLATLTPYILAQYHIKYIIVHKDLLTPTKYANIISFLTNILGMPFYQDSEIVAFRMNFSPYIGLDQYPIASNSSLFSTLYGGWYKYGRFGGGGRVMDFFAGLNVYSATNQYVQLEFKMKGMAHDYPIQLSVNGQIVGTYLASSKSFTTFSTPFILMHQGLNQVMFDSLNGCNQPVSKNSYTQTATGCISVKFAWIDPITSTFAQSGTA